MNGRKGVDGLQLDYQAFAHKQIQSPLSHCTALVFYAHWDLAFVLDASQGQLDPHRLFVCTLQIPRPEVAVHLDRRTYHGIGKMVDLSANIFNSHAHPFFEPRRRGVLEKIRQSHLFLLFSD